jgi:hypothetical protein
MENTIGNTKKALERRHFQLEAQGADITNDLRDAHHGSTIEHTMVNLNHPHGIVNRGKRPLKRERVSTLPTPIA